MARHLQVAMALGPTLDVLLPDLAPVVPYYSPYSATGAMAAHQVVVVVRAEPAVRLANDPARIPQETRLIMSPGVGMTSWIEPIGSTYITSFVISLLHVSTLPRRGR
jgi:hypothetical protein